MSQYKFIKLNKKGKKVKDKTEYPPTEQLQKVNIHIIQIPEEKTERKRIFEIIMSENFPKLMTDTKL